MKTVSSQVRSESGSACPCCGYAAIGRSNKTCQVCDWENDGHDNQFAFRYSARNQTNLNLARHRFLTARRKPVSTDRALQTRFFKLDETGGFIVELNEKGRPLYRGPIPFVDYAELANKTIAAIPLKLKRG